MADSNVKKLIIRPNLNKISYLCIKIKACSNNSDLMKYADYISEIEIESLWSGTKHIRWTLDPKVNILSGINGVGKSTILNRVVRSLSSVGTGGERALPKNTTALKIKTVPEDARWIRYDVIRSFDRPLMSSELVNKVVDASVTTELDWQIYQLQRKYLDYQVNIGNRIIGILSSGDPDGAAKAQEISAPKARFQDMLDHLFAETGKQLIRTKNDIAFSQIGEELTPYQLSSGEKQMLVILLTVLIEDGQPYILFMDEPEISLHIDWQQRLIDLIIDLNPNIQIILTTHSPAVIMNGWMDKVTEVTDITV